MISRRRIMMGIVGIFLTGWLIFAFTAPRDPIVNTYFHLGFWDGERYVFRSDGSFLHLDSGRQLAAGGWEFQGFKELREPWRGGKLVTAREYSLLTETFQPGQHIPDRVLLVSQPGYVMIDGTPYHRGVGWLEQIKFRFLNWFR